MTPEGWRQSTLGRHLRESIKNGYSPTCPTVPTGKWIAHLGSVTSNGFMRTAVKPAPPGDPKVDAFRLLTGDLLVSRSNTRERVGLAGIYRGDPAPCSYPDLLMRVRPSEDLDAEFLLNALLSRAGREYFKTVARGTSGSMVKIDRALLEAFPLLLPPLTEQRGIAAVLSAVDAAIAATEAVADEVDRVRRLVADHVLLCAPEGARGGDACRERLPREWAERPLYEVATVQTGIAKGKPTPGASVEVPYLRVANVQDGYVDLAEVKGIRVEPEALKRYSLRAGDVLFTEGGDFDKLGRGCVWRGQIVPCLHQNHVFAVRTSDALLPDFLAAYAASSRGRAYFLDCAKRTTNLASINSTQLKAFRVPVPPLDQQQAIVAAISALAERAERERATLAQTRSLKAALAEALLAGHVRVPDPKAIAAVQPPAT